MRKPSINEMILSLSFCSALFYWLNCKDPSALVVAAKTTSTVLLALHSYQTALPHLANQVGITMGLHCAGDLLIELPGNSILLALAAFFLGHGNYFLLLQKNCESLAEITLSKKIMLGAFGIFAAGFTQLLTTKTSGIIHYAIPFYSFALSSMFIAACLQKENTVRATLGGAAYVTSDMLIATNMFLKKIPNAGCVTWPLYFLAQNLLRATYQTESTKVNMPIHAM